MPKREDMRMLPYGHIHTNIFQELVTFPPEAPACQMSGRDMPLAENYITKNSSWVPDMYLVITKIKIFPIVGQPRHRLVDKSCFMVVVTRFIESRLWRGPINWATTRAKHSSAGWGKG